MKLDNLKIKFCLCALFWCVCSVVSAQEKDICFKFELYLGEDFPNNKTIVPSDYLRHPYTLICQSCSNDTFKLESWYEHPGAVRNLSTSFHDYHTNVSLGFEKLDGNGVYKNYCDKVVKDYHTHWFVFDTVYEDIFPGNRFFIRGDLIFGDSFHFLPGDYRLYAVFRRLNGRRCYLQKSTNFYHFKVL